MNDEKNILKNYCEHGHFKLTCVFCAMSDLIKRIEELEKHSFNYGTKILVENESLKILDVRVKKLENYKKPKYCNECGKKNE